MSSESSRVGQAVRDNPVPLALIGLGIGWLTITGLRGRGESAGEAGESLSAGTSAAPWGSTGATPDFSGSAGAGFTGGGMAGAATYGGAEASGYERMGSSAGGDGRNIKARAGEMANRARDTMSEAAERTRGRLSQWGQSIGSQASDAADRTRDAYNEHPLTMGVVAALMGAALGAWLPRTRQEREMLGETAGQLLRAGRETGAELMDRTARAAERVMDKAKQEGAEAISSLTETAKGEAKAMTDKPSSTAGSSGMTPGLH